jgi:predicted DCC family thiol-disulfide oxidoreductase YuxK
MNGPEPPVVFFDSRCLLCHRSVRWLLRRDPEGHLSFAGLDSKTAEAIIPADHPLRKADTVVLWDGSALHGRSEAVFRTLGWTRSSWRWLRVFSFLPRPWTDAVYRFVARRRYRWFGTDDSCPLPDPSERDRFLP